MINIKKKIKIAYVQLPLIDHGYNYVQGNILTAPGAISAYLNYYYKEYIEENYIIPADIMNFASDDVIIRLIDKISPDVLVFTNYLWNAERHLCLSQKIKKLLNIVILFGGPEISEDSYLLTKRRSSVDIFVKGEGELFFDKLFSNDLENNLKIVNGNTLFVQKDNELLDACKIREPFSNGYLNISNDKSTFIEITRGCHFRCSYCNYSKFGNKVRELPENAFFKAIDNKKRKIKEIYIISPSFTGRKDWRDILKRLGSKKPKLSIHTEIRPENISEDDAFLLKKAGVNSLEVGMQTFTKEALLNAGRNSNSLKAVEGLKNLRKAGIDLKIGMIPGLPGDDPVSFLNGIYKLVEEGFSDEIEFYPLMVLPGTAVREICDRNNYNYMKKPPYYFISGGNFRKNDINYIRERMEEITDIETSIKRIPDLSSDESPVFVKGLKCNFSELIKLNKYTVDSNVFTFIITIKTNKEAEALIRYFADLVLNWELINIIVDGDYFIKEKIELFDEGFHFYKRMRYYDGIKNGKIKQFYHATESIDFYEKIKNSYTEIEPVLKLSMKNMDYVIKTEPPLLLIMPGGLGDKCMEKISNKYRDYFERITFEDKKDMKTFYKNIGLQTADYFFRAEIISI